MRNARGATTLLGLSLLCLSLPLSSSAQAEGNAVGVGVQLHSDDGELDGQERVAVQPPRDQDRSFHSADSLSFSLWGLKDLSQKLRAGGGLRYYGTYSLVDDVPEDTPEDEQPEPEEFGTWMELYGQVEWHTPLAMEGKLELVLGAQLGATLLFPGGAFEAEIDRLKEQNVGVWSAPRLGFLFGPQVGVRYQLIELVAIRLDAGMRYNRVFLFSTAEEVDGIAFEKTWDLNILRYDANLGVEVNF